MALAQASGYRIETLEEMGCEELAWVLEETREFVARQSRAARPSRPAIVKQ